MNYNPWLNKAPDHYPKDVRWVGNYSAEDRIAELKSFDSAKLRAVIAWPGTQKTVRTKAQVYLRQRKKHADKSGG